MIGKEIKQGEIIKLSLHPTKGHEQTGYRPVLVVSNASYSRVSNMTIVCPITNTDRQNPVHVRLDGLITKGFVMCDQVRAIDVRAREYKVIETVDDETLWEVCDIIQGSVEVEP
ncbi:MAG: type II toxin-antitoxin system PemK/MazF family toxin [Firmicutes bacterium]|nr:type II toxin-antitoxin system PemK/MazF family toxin [Bacillota bacterium]